ADIAEAAARHLTKRAHDAVLEHLAADKADLGVPLGLLGEMLAGAEADLEPDILDGCREQGARIEPPLLGQADRQSRQQFFLKLPLAGPQRPRPPPAIQPAGRRAFNRAALHEAKLVGPGPGRRPRTRKPYSRGLCP